MILSYFQL